MPDPRGNPIRRTLLTMLYAAKLRRRLRGLKADVIIPVNADMLGVARLALFPFSRTPIVYDMQDIMGERLPFHYRVFYRFLLQTTSALLVQSDRFISAYVEPNRLTRKGTPVVSIPNAVAGWDYVHPPRQDSGHITIGYFGNLRGATQIDILIEAAKAAQDSGRDIRLNFAGGGPEAVRIAEISETTSFIEFRGVYDYALERDDLYGRADIIYAVYPQEVPNNRFHIARRFQEAVLLGIPIIVAAGSYMAEIVKESGVGWSVDSERPEALKELLLNIYDKQTSLRRCTEASLLVRDRYSFESYVNPLLDVLDAVAKSG